MRGATPPGASHPLCTTRCRPADSGRLPTSRASFHAPIVGSRPDSRTPRCGDEKDPPRTRQSPVALAAFPPWGSWPGWRHAGSRRPVYEATPRPGDSPRVGVGLARPVGCSGPACAGHRRIRLVAYGARLESVLGESPRGFESPILRHVRPCRSACFRGFRHFPSKIRKLPHTFVGPDVLEACRNRVQVIVEEVRVGVEHHRGGRVAEHGRGRGTGRDGGAPWRSRRTRRCPRRRPDLRLTLRAELLLAHARPAPITQSRA